MPNTHLPGSWQESPPLQAGLDQAPYDELDRQWEAARGNLIGGGEAPGPEDVGAVIADAIESTEPKLRWPVGADAGRRDSSAD